MKNESNYPTSENSFVFNFNLFLQTWKHHHVLTSLLSNLSALDQTLLLVPMVVFMIPTMTVKDMHLVAAKWVLRFPAFLPLEEPSQHQSTLSVKKVVVDARSLLWLISLTSPFIFSILESAVVGSC